MREGAGWRQTSSVKTDLLQTGGEQRVAGMMAGGGGGGVDRLLNVSESEVRQRKEGGWILWMDGRCLLTKRHVRTKRYYRKIWYVILSSSK